MVFESEWIEERMINRLTGIVFHSNRQPLLRTDRRIETDWIESIGESCD